MCIGARESSHAIRVVVNCGTQTYKQLCDFPKLLLMLGDLGVVRTIVALGKKTPNGVCQ